MAARQKTGCEQKNKLPESGMTTKLQASHAESICDKYCSKYSAQEGACDEIILPLGGSDYYTLVKQTRSTVSPVSASQSNLYQQHLSVSNYEMMGEKPGELHNGLSRNCNGLSPDYNGLYPVHNGLTPAETKDTICSKEACYKDADWSTVEAAMQRITGTEVVPYSDQFSTNQEDAFWSIVQRTNCTH